MIKSTKSIGWKGCIRKSHTGLMNGRTLSASEYN